MNPSGLSWRLSAKLVDQVKLLRGKLLGVRQQKRSLQEFKTLRAALAKNPKDAASVSKLVDLLIVQWDDPVKAKEYAFVADKKTQELIELANKPVKSMRNSEIFLLNGLMCCFPRFFFL